MNTKVYIVASSNTESTKVFTDPLFAQDYCDELIDKGETVELIGQNIEVPYATDRRKYGMTLKEVRDEIAAFKDCSFTEATKKAETFRQNCCVPLTWIVSVRLSFGKYSRTKDGKVEYYGENRDVLNFVYYDRDGERHNFSIID